MRIVATANYEMNPLVTIAPLSRLRAQQKIPERSIPDAELVAEEKFSLTTTIADGSLYIIVK